MAYKKKCPVCQSCLDMIWILPKRFYHCWLCKDFYDIINNELVVVSIDDMGFPQELVDDILETLKNEQSR